MSLSVKVSAVLLFLLSVFLTACAPAVDSPGRLQVRISDHREAIGDFARLDITVESIGIHPASAPRTAGWINLEPDIVVVDLTQVVGGPSITVLETSLQQGIYDAVRLTVREAQGVLQDGSTVEAAGFEQAARLEFVLQSGDSITIVVDVIVESEDDHPGGGYQINLSSAAIERANE